MIKHGEIVYVKTTEEPVFVLSVDKKDDVEHVTVRRPVKVDGGVAHKIDHFFSEELCSFHDLIEASVKRQITENAARLRYEEAMQGAAGVSKKASLLN